MRVVYILTGYHLLLGWNLVDVSGDEDTLSLGGGGWFNDPVDAGGADHFRLELVHLVWQDEGKRQPFEVFLAVQLHQLRQMLIHAIFATDLSTLRKVIHFLVAVQTLI